MLAPGRKINLILGKGPDFFPKDGGGVPLRYEVEVDYCVLEHQRRVWRRRKHYTDPPLILDLMPFKYSAQDRDDLHQIHQSLKDIKQVMKSWTRGDRLRINAVSQAELDEQEAEWWASREADSGAVPMDNRPTIQSRLRGWISKASA